VRYRRHRAPGALVPDGDAGARCDAPPSPVPADPRTHWMCVELYEPRVAKKLSAENLVASIAGLLLQDHGIITAQG